MAQQSLQIPDFHENSLEDEVLVVGVYLLELVHLYDLEIELSDVLLGLLHEQPLLLVEPLCLVDLRGRSVYVLHDLLEQLLFLLLLSHLVVHYLVERKLLQILVFQEIDLFVHVFLSHLLL